MESEPGRSAASDAVWPGAEAGGSETTERTTRNGSRTNRTGLAPDPHVTSGDDRLRRCEQRLAPHGCVLSRATRRHAAGDRVEGTGPAGGGGGTGPRRRL